MQKLSTAECKQLIQLEERLLQIAHTAELFKADAKQLKVYKKVVKIERKHVKKLGFPTDEELMTALDWKYAELYDIIKKLAHTNKVRIITKATADLNLLIADTQKTISELKAQLVQQNAQNIVDKIETAAQTLGSKVQSFGEKAEQSLKKLFAGEGSSKSE